MIPLSQLTTFAGAPGAAFTFSNVNSNAGAPASFPVYFHLLEPGARSSEVHVARLPELRENVPPNRTCISIGELQPEPGARSSEVHVAPALAFT